MTTATHHLAGQSTAQSMPGQQGTFGPGFPPPIGAEQIFGLVPPLTQIPYPAQLAGTAHQPVPGYGAVPWQQVTTPFTFSPVVQQVAAQIAPMAQQALLPYVIGAACQQVQQQLPQLVAQIVGGQGQPLQYQPPMWGGGIFGQFSRPYSYLS